VKDRGHKIRLFLSRGKTIWFKRTLYHRAFSDGRVDYKQNANKFQSIIISGIPLFFKLHKKWILKVRLPKLPVTNIWVTLNQSQIIDHPITRTASVGDNKLVWFVVSSEKRKSGKCTYQMDLEHKSFLRTCTLFSAWQAHRSWGIYTASTCSRGNRPLLPGSYATVDSYFKTCLGAKWQFLLQNIYFPDINASSQIYVWLYMCMHIFMQTHMYVLAPFSNSEIAILSLQTELRISPKVLLSSSLRSYGRSLSDIFF